MQAECTSQRAHAASLGGSKDTDNSFRWGRILSSHSWWKWFGIGTTLPKWWDSHLTTKRVFRAKGHITDTTYTCHSVQERTRAIKYNKMWEIICGYNQLWVVSTNGNAVYLIQLIMVILTDQLPFSTEKAKCMLLSHQLQFYLGMLSRWQAYVQKSTTLRVNFDLFTCCTVKEVTGIKTKAPNKIMWCCMRQFNLPYELSIFAELGFNSNCPSLLYLVRLLDWSSTTIPSSQQTYAEWMQSIISLLGPGWRESLDWEPSISCTVNVLQVWNISLY